MLRLLVSLISTLLAFLGGEVPGKIIDPSFSTGSMLSPCFRVSPDGRHLAYPRTIGDKRALVVDGVTGQAYDDIWPVCLAPTASTWPTAPGAAASGSSYSTGSKEPNMTPSETPPSGTG